MQNSENIKVAVRFREGKIDENIKIDTLKGIVKLEDQEFIFDKVFDTKTTQETIFNDLAKNIVEWVIEGYNSTIFAYGSTGCLDPYTKVLLYDKTTKYAKDIKIGDVLMGDNLEPRNVLQLFSGTDDMYDIIRENDISYTVNKSHILTLKFKGIKRLIVKDKNFYVSYGDEERMFTRYIDAKIFYNSYDVIDISVEDYLKKSERWKNNYNGIKVSFDEGKNTYHKIIVKYKNNGFYNGFMLDKNHRFLLSDGTITHNSGKTYTMFGNADVKNQLGIIPRTCEELFNIINSKDDVIEAQLKCSFLEIYMEQIKDLLQNNSKNLKIRQNNDNVYVQGLTEKYVYNTNDIMNQIKTGYQYRSIASTALNNTSSRSHAVLTLTLTQKIQDNSIITSKLHLIDLAGSENVAKSEAQGITLTEAQNINKSLSCLGNVIYALTEKNRDHIPYRDSKLTYLLQDSLGGNAKTVLIATANPAVYNETLSTLKFAKRAKEIKNAPKINKNDSIENLLATIEKLN